MALDPNAYAPSPWSWAPPEWDQPMVPAVPDQASDPSLAASPDELAIRPMGDRSGGPTPPPPPPPPSTDQAPMRGRGGATDTKKNITSSPAGMPQEEVPHGAVQDWPPAAAGPAPGWAPSHWFGAAAQPSPDQAAAPEQPAAPEQHASSLPDTSFQGLVQKPLDDAAKKVDDLTPEQLGKYMAGQSVEHQEMYRGMVEGARQKMAAARSLEISQKALDEAEANARARQESIKAAQERGARLDQQAQALANQNPLDSISGGRKILGILAAIVGGFAANKTGRNMGLEAVDQIANDAAAQQAQKLGVLKQQRAQVGEDIAQAGDTFHAAEAVRLAVYDGAAKKLESEVQNFDPRGTTALRIMDQINAIKAKRAEILSKGVEEDQKRIEAAAKIQIDALKAREEQRHNIAGEKNDAIRAGADYTRAQAEKDKAKAETEVLPVAYYQAMYPNHPEAIPPGPMSKKDYASWIENNGKAQQQHNTSLATTNAMPSLLVKDKSGNSVPFVATGEPPEVAKLRAREAKIRSLVGLIDDARRTRTGWSSNTGNSEEKQQLDAIWGQAKIAAKDAFELGQITAADEGLIKGALGTDDPSKLRDPLPGMEKARSLLVKSVRGDLEAHGYPKDQPYDIPDLQKNAATITPEQFDLKFVLDPKHGESYDAHSGKADEHGGHLRMSPKQKDIVDGWISDLNSSDEQKRNRAAQYLGQVANKASLSTTKEYAKQALDNASSLNNIPASTDELEPRVK